MLRDVLLAVVIGGGVFFAGHALTPSAAPAPTPVQPCPDGKCPTPAPPKPKRPWGGKADAARAVATDFVALETSDHDKEKGTYKLREWPASRAEVIAWLDSASKDGNTWGIKRQNPDSIRGPPFAPFGAKVGGPALDGAEISCDYPGARHRRNTSSKGLGLCVFTSIHHACDWADIPALLEMPQWMISKGIAGGGYPGKVASLIPQLCQERGMPVPNYIQVQSNDLSILRAACDSGRMPCITYSVSPTGRYGGSRISHMTNLVHMDDTHAVVLDSNYTGYDKFEWMTHAEFLRTYSGGGTGWSVIFLDSPPPPPPHNGTPAPKPAPQAQPASPIYGWYPARSRADWMLLYDGETQIGRWDSKTRKFHRLKPDGHYENVASEPPYPSPDAIKGGVEWGQIAEERYLHGQYEVSRDDVMIALSVPNDGKSHRITYVGADKARADAQWKGAPAEVKGAYLFKGYAPDHWHVKDYGFAPGLTITDATGKYLGYWDALPSDADLYSALRRLHSDSKPPSGGVPGGVPVLPLAVLSAAGVLAYLLGKRNNAPVQP